TLKHLGTVSENNSTNTPSVNSGSEPVNTRQLDPNDSSMPELEIFHKYEIGIFDEASYDEEGVITDFNNLPTEIKVSPTPTLRIHNIHQKSQILGDPKSAVRNLKRFLKLYKMTVGFKPCKRSCYSLSCNRFIKVVHTALYRLHQAPRAWYGYSINIPREARIQEGTIAILNLLKRRPEGYHAGSSMSSMGELTFFLGLQVKQNKEGIFISQDKYVAEILKKFDLVSVKTAITPIETKVALTKDEEVVDVDVTPKTSHLNAVKRIFKYLKGKPNLGLCTICIAKNPVYHSKTKHIEIRHHFIRDCYEKKLISVEKIHTDLNVADLLTKPFDGPRFNFLVTATLAKTLANGTLELHATIDTIAYTITEASIRNKLQLLDASGITMLPNNEIFEGWGILGFWRLLTFEEKDPEDSYCLIQKRRKIEAPKGRKYHDLDPSSFFGTRLEKRYKRRKSSKESAGTGLDFEEVKSAFEEVNTGGIKVSARIEEINAGKIEESMQWKDLRFEDLPKAGGIVNQRRKHFAEERARAKRDKPMTQTQLRNYMSNFLKNQGTWKLTQLKKLNFEEVKAKFEKLVRQLDTYGPMNFEAKKESLKRFGEKLQTKTAKKIKFDNEGYLNRTEESCEEDKDDKPTKKTGKRRKQIARKGFHTHLDKDESEDSDEANEKDDSTLGTKIPINPVPVATKSPGIANYKIIKQGRKGVYQIVRENGTDMVYISFGAMLTDISRDDLTELYRIVMRKHGMNEPEDEFEKVLWEYLKNMLKRNPLYSYNWRSARVNKG
ncbi:ribonuclease H-like domain-containing protein, partial [Tanacetum coccineum]